MSKKLIIISSLLVIAFALLATGAWLLANRPHSGNAEGAMEIAVVPGPGSVLPNSNGELSKILLESVKIEEIVFDKQYDQIIPNHTIKPGDPMLSLTLTIQNTHPEYKIVGISAVGYDSSGVQVAITLDDILHGMAWTQLEYQETGEVTLHLNFSKNIKSIKIFGNVYQYPIP
jgi:hypothetical protein